MTSPEPPASAENADRILMVDDDATNLEILGQILAGHGYRLSVSRSGENALELARRIRPLLVLLDVVMPGIDGYETCRRLKADPDTADVAVIFLSALEDTRDKVRGLEAGAVDFISKPFQGDEILARVQTHLTLQRLRRQLEARNQELARELDVAQELLSDARRRVEGALMGESPAIRALRESIAAHAATAEAILLTGPQGAGQEAVARSIHHASLRNRQAFIHVNCALLPGASSTSLFGRRVDGGAGGGVGLPHRDPMELADRGTLYLEEVHRLGGEVQARLAESLDALQGARERGEAPAYDVRVIASTSASLGTESPLQSKLLALLQGRQLRVPALAERPEDVPELSRYFVERHARRIGSVVEAISDESLKRLAKYRWPGNVGELQSLLERAVTSAQGPVLEIDPAALDEGLPLGSYRLIEKLGEGGMGQVWRARHQLLMRPCAVKLIKLELLGESNRESAIARFRLEAKAIARLSSPNTVRLYDFGVSEAGAFYFVMELLEGQDLMSLVQRFGPLPPERVVAVLRQVCRSLGEAHASGLLHRDLKPHNLFLCRLGLEYDVLKVLDFGLVKSVREGEANLTADGALTGTPAYMPPERVLGGPAEERSDLYALGCVAYWMLTGQTVFMGEPMAMMIHHARTAPRPPSQASGLAIPERLEEIVLACLEKTPQKRPASAVELWRQLGEVPLEAPWTPERAEAWWRSNLPDLSIPGLRPDSTGELTHPELR